MNTNEIIKIIARIKRDIEKLEKAVLSNNMETSKNSENNELRGQAIEIIEMLNKKLNARFSINADKNIKHITARLREGYNTDDFLAVIESKQEEWANDPKMYVYLRPETLFGSKFDGYLNAARSKMAKENKKSYVKQDIENEIIRRLIS